MKLIFSLLVGSILLFSCKSNKDAAKQEIRQANYMNYGLKKGACFGTCPVLSMEIQNNGLATLDAQRNYRITGKYKAIISEKYMIKLHDAFQNANFLDFPDEYESMIADLPTIELLYSNGEVEKSVKGKEGRPTELVELQFLLEEVCDNTNWEFVEASSSGKKEEKEEIILSELIIQFKPGTLLPRWFKKYEKYDLRIVKPIAKEQNIWLASYNNLENVPDTVINEIGSDSEVVNVEFNKKIDKRAGKRN